MRDRFSRQSFLGEDSEAILSSLTVAVVGLGGGGSHVAQQLAHVGVGHFLLFDPQSIDDSNLNRLIGGTVADVVRARQKTAIARRLIKGINPAASVQAFQSDWRPHGKLLRACDAIVGCVDSYRARSDLEFQARRYLVPYVDIGMDVHKMAGGNFVVGGQVILSMPGGPCLRCVGFVRDELLKEEARGYGDAGPRPQVVWSNGVLASLAVGIVVGLYTPWGDATAQPVYLEYDGNRQVVHASRRLAYAPGACLHFNENDCGDPWFALRDRPDRR